MNGYFGAVLSVLLGAFPDLANLGQLAPQLNTWCDLILKFLSLVSVLLIIILNLKKIRSNASA